MINILNDDNNVEFPNIIKLLKFVLLNVVDVAYKFDIDDNNDVDVVFKLLIYNDVDVEKLEKVAKGRRGEGEGGGDRGGERG